MDQLTSLTFRAEAAYGHTGAYVARITGRAPKTTFLRLFVGRKVGRDSEAIVDDPGLYESQDVDRKGNKLRTYRVVLSVPELGGFRSICVEQDVAQQIAKALGTGQPIEQICHFAGNGGTLKSGRPDFVFQWGPAPVASPVVADIIGEEVRGAIEAIRFTLDALTPEQRGEVLAALAKGSN